MTPAPKEHPKPEQKHINEFTTADRLGGIETSEAQRICGVCPYKDGKGCDFGVIEGIRTDWIEKIPESFISHY